jgi:membrane-bound acyltransferase YfiQ involved in biofilm formation
MPLLNLTLVLIAVVAVIGHLAFWALAYHRVSGIEKWSRQAAALISFWWVFDKFLLPQEHDHLRIKAMGCLFVYVSAGAAAWYLS